jgi:hypothetical protein
MIRRVSIAAPMKDLTLLLAARGRYHPIRLQPVSNSSLSNSLSFMSSLTPLPHDMQPNGRSGGFSQDHSILNLIFQFLGYLNDRHQGA